MTGLERLRLDAHLSRVELGKRVNLRAETIKSIEEGERRPQIGSLAKLSTYFGVPASTLVRPAPELDHLEPAA